MEWFWKSKSMPNTHWFDWMCFILGLTQPRILTPNWKQLNTPGHMGNRNTEGTQKTNPGKHLSWRSSWINIESTATALVPLPEHTSKAPTIRLRQPLTISDVEEMRWRGWWESVSVAGIFDHNSRDLRELFQQLRWDWSAIWRAWKAGTERNSPIKNSNVIPTPFGGGTWENGCWD